MKALPCAVLLVLATACHDADEGIYRVQTGNEVTPGSSEYEIVGNSGMRLRARARFGKWHLDNSNIHVDLAITNTVPTPLSVQPDLYRLDDGIGLYPPSMPPEPQCEGHTQAVTQLREGETCQLHLQFGRVGGPGRWRSFHLIHDGVSRGGIPVPVFVGFIRTNADD